MLNINRNNYEIFFIDYMENTLSQDEREQVELFMDCNPDLKEEFFSLMDVNLPEERVVFSEKESLKKNLVLPDASPLENLSIAYMEGDITIPQERELKEMLSNAVNQREHDLIQHTKLQSDLSIQFPKKSELKKKHSKFIRLLPYTAAAASAALLIGFGLQLGQLEVKQSPKAQAQTEISTTVQKKEILISTPQDENKTKTDTEQPIKTKENKTVQNDTNEEILIPVQPIPAKTTETEKAIQRESFNIQRLETKQVLLAEAKLNKKLMNSNFAADYLMQSIDNEFPDVKIDRGENSSDLAKRIEVVRKKRKRDFLLWTVADAGIKMVNKITGGEMSLEREYDETGNMTALRYDSKRYQYEKKMD